MLMGDLLGLSTGISVGHGQVATVCRSDRDTASGKGILGILAAGVGVLVSDDVILAQISARLNLDKNNRQFAGVL